VTALTYHAAACRDGCLPGEFPADSRDIWGKAVLMARRPLAVPATFAARVAAANARSDWPRIADVPAAGENLRPGQPLVSVFAQADSPSDVRRQLRRFAGSVNEWVGNSDVRR
jgi:predicted ATP-grasp superfamily ATP-dependent carboligase